MAKNKTTKLTNKQKYNNNKIDMLLIDEHDRIFSIRENRIIDISELQGCPINKS